MNNKLVIVYALVAGLVGGLLTRYVAPPAAFAQNQTPVIKEIRAQSFTLVDSSNRIVGTFTSDADGPPAPPPAPGSITPPPLRRSPVGRSRIVLRDSDGREIWSAGEAQIRPLSQR
ncbi:MAG: hypothetical protein LAP61_15600 [Acidobacteriia bacterium]|nr:hypothetical protein [Terriglobia bacterium]